MRVELPGRRTTGGPGVLPMCGRTCVGGRLGVEAQRRTRLQGLELRQRHGLARRTVRRSRGPARLQSCCPLLAHRRRRTRSAPRCRGRRATWMVESPSRTSSHADAARPGRGRRAKAGRRPEGGRVPQHAPPVPGRGRVARQSSGRAQPGVRETLREDGAMPERVDGALPGVVHGGWLVRLVRVVCRGALFGQVHASSAR